MEAAVQNAPGRPRGRRLRVLFLHLSENLRLTDHHGIQTGSDPKDVTDRFASFVHVEVGRNVRDRQPVLRGQELRQRRFRFLRVLRAENQFHAIAGRHDHALVDPR